MGLPRKTANVDMFRYALKALRKTVFKWVEYPTLTRWAHIQFPAYGTPALLRIRVYEGYGGC
jgi:hypothetical protein